MKFANVLALAALTAVSAENGLRSEQRRLDDAAPEEKDLTAITDSMCTACDICDALDTFDLCDINEIQNLACANCDSFGVDGLCLACTFCDAAGDLCDLNTVTSLGCGLCPDDGGDGGDGSDGGLIPGSDSGLCFSEVATVQVLGSDSTATTTSMKDLKVGDRVLTADGSYQSVYAFGHHHPTIKASFFQIYSKNAENALEVTADHLIFLQDKSSPVPAQDIKVGDVLRGADSAGSAVTKIGTVERSGIYAPMTNGGTVVVDGVAASSYIHLNEKQQQFLSDHDLIHLTLSPYRLLCNGVSGAFCDTKYYLSDGMPFYAHYGLELLHFLMKSNVVVRTLGMSTIFFLTGTSQVLENLFGASMAPLLVFLAISGYISHTNSKKSKAKAL